MRGVGIDVGTDSVRVCIHGGRSGSLPLTREANGEENTMRTEHLWGQICNLLDGLIPLEERAMQSDSELAANLDQHRPKSSEKNIAAAGESNESWNTTKKNIGPVSKSFQEGPFFAIGSLAWFVSATCSTVVVERVHDSGSLKFIPLEDIVVWMDCRAQQQAKSLSSMMPKDALSQIGGRVTPEMGIAKLKWIDERYKNGEKDVVVFELYDWVSYLLAAGGIEDGMVSCLDNDTVTYQAGSRAMDGSIKGWGRDIMDALDISVKIGAVPSVFQAHNALNNKVSFTDPSPSISGRLLTLTSEGEGLATFLGDSALPRKLPGKIHGTTDSKLADHNDYSQFVLAGEPLAPCKYIGGTVLHGCIDCYAGVVADEILHFRNTLNDSSLDHKNKASSTSTMTELIDMVAGTSTCILAKSSITSPIEGMWGPYNQLVCKNIFACGQPATGKLFADLLRSTGETFDSIESKALCIEKDYGLPLTILARHHLYSGDRYGNRSPFGDFTMDEVRVSGGNGTKAAGIGIFHDDNDAVLRYYLTIEFLVFQTKQLLRNSPDIRQFRVSGSQGKNTRFMRLLKEFALSDSKHLEFSVKENVTYSGASAGALIASGQTTDMESLNGRKLAVEPLTGTERAVLDKKYEAFLALASWQREFREKIATINLE